MTKKKKLNRKRIDMKNRTTLIEAVWRILIVLVGVVFWGIGLIGTFLWGIILIVGIICYPALLSVWVLPFICLFFKRTRPYAKAFLWWTLCPLGFPEAAEENKWIKHQWKSWLLVSHVIILDVVLVAVLVEPFPCDERPVPQNTNYHSSKDLYRATLMEFPEVIPVDSSYYSSGLESYSMSPSFESYTTVKLVPKKKLTKAFYKRLDKACSSDHLYWHKEDEGYLYSITYAPANGSQMEKGFDRSKYDEGGREEENDMTHYQIKIYVPLKGDTITVIEGSYR